jgi:P27 family predicted phage terminase small subunit
VAKVLESPIELDEHGKSFWNEHAPKLKELGLLSEIDLHLLALGAQWWSVHVRALDGLKESITQVSEANGRVARPEVAVAKQAFNAVRAIMQEFGIGPGSRTKVSAARQDEVDPVDKYFSQKPSVRSLLA